MQTSSLSSKGVQPYAELLGTLCSFPCSSAATLFEEAIVQGCSKFEVSLHALLPILTSQQCTAPNRILAAFIIYSFYLPYPITLNAFYQPLIEIFNKERKALLCAEGEVKHSGASESLVWVLWTILHGRGEDIATSTSNYIATAKLLPAYRASQLSFDGEDSGASGRLSPLEVPRPRVVPDQTTRSDLLEPLASPPIPQKVHLSPSNYIFTSPEGQVSYRPVSPSEPSVRLKMTRSSSVDARISTGRHCKPVTQHHAVSIVSPSSNHPHSLPPTEVRAPQIVTALPERAFFPGNDLETDSTDDSVDITSSLDQLLTANPIWGETHRLTLLAASRSSHISAKGEECTDRIHPNSQIPKTKRAPRQTSPTGPSHGGEPAQAVEARVPHLLSKAAKKALTLSELRFLQLEMPSVPVLAMRDLVGPFAVEGIIKHNATASGFIVGMITRLLYDKESNIMTNYGDIESELTAPVDDNIKPYLHVLQRLPPTLPIFNLMTKLLHSRECTPRSEDAEAYLGSLGSSKLISHTTIGHLVEGLVLIPFVSNCIGVIEGWEKEEEIGLLSDDRVMRSIHLLCMFCRSLFLPAPMLPNSPMDSSQVQNSFETNNRALSSPSVVQGLVMEMRTFSLRHAKYEGAQSLYVVLSTWNG